MKKTETRSTPHPLRTIILRFDPAKEAPEFETLALESFRELHDRMWEIQQRIQQGRRRAFPFTLLIEDAEELFRQAKDKFKHLKVMIPENPEKETVWAQLKDLLSKINEHLLGFIDELINETEAFYAYDDYIFEYDQWMNDVAFPQFDEVFKRYEECAVDMVSFDRDLDDFKGVLSAVKRQESKYYDMMNEAIEHYSELNEEMANLFEEVEDFDPELLGDDLDSK
ncbi:hypothetical protein [Sphingobacterium wenxiniae]|uniref:Uncharacterized protein n=1 Tax=Sphingobacterium wenxiniae TaxID=683125 RepID=A0A1I6P062_9SPHI|nr:hypothetical protein [Sphingobacterium wenxiniae]SFS33468.1 hypothetical protein SAMN05660206_101201 [Sphingobacterium wenxiniae]